MKPVYFETVDRGDPTGAAPAIRPWKQVPLDPAYSGAWVVAGDVNNDGKVEVVSARNVNRGDVHYTSTAVAQDLDGRVLWRWGDPRVGRRGLHHDVACQIHDWDGDGRNEVVLCLEGFLVELDGATGAERRRLPIPPEATDCLVFADLSGRGRAADVLVKTRYSHIWAMDYAGNLLWTVEKPGGCPTAHQPVPIDIDGDGRDEIMAGYATLNPDGQVRWAFGDGGRPALGGHLDCCRVLRRGPSPKDWRLVLTCCGAKKLVAIDGSGRLLWEVPGGHFESIDVGRIHPGRPGLQILVDVVPPTAGRFIYPLWVLDEDGQLLGQITTDYARFHTLVDWNGDGYDEVVVPHSRGLFDGQGKRIGTFAMEAQEDIYGGQPVAEGEIGNIVLRGDMTRSGAVDVLITTPPAVYIFRNPNGRGTPESAVLGCGTNFTLY
jgi:hypothetical protein